MVGEMLWLTLGIAAGCVTRLAALLRIVRYRLPYAWLGVFLGVGVLREAWLVWLLAAHGGRGYTQWQRQTVGLMALLVLATCLEAAWKLAKCVKEKGK